MNINMNINININAINYLIISLTDINITQTFSILVFNYAFAQTM